MSPPKIVFNADCFACWSICTSVSSELHAQNDTAKIIAKNFVFTVAPKDVKLSSILTGKLINRIILKT